ncbi:DNA polymerase III subunit beta [Eubacterium xylanophilum]|uniref:DNA polymerase III subunit beta n=1 Tax=Eubacterium xylanophilum TaxID=39497 RepID=UPI00047CBA1A|nr:DNA polymerase III subunit beta [Eubacterium xylanophilum]
MKFTCNKNDINNSLDIVLKAVPSKTTMPVLECVVIETLDDSIKLTTNDMSLGIEARFEASIEEKGIILVNAKMLFDIIRKLPNESLSFEADENNNILIFCGKSKFNIMGMDHEEFPLLPTIDKSNKITISQFTLREMIKQTIFSISNNESNKIYTGELFEISGDNIKITSLDLHRASIRNNSLKESFDDIKSVIPGKTLNEVVKILNGGIDDEVEIYFTNNHVLFEIPNIIIISRLIEGNFYNVNQMINNDYEIKVKVSKRELLESIDRATLLLRESENKPVIMNIVGNEIKMEMNTKIGSMDENIVIEKEGKDLRIGFDPKFFIDALKVIDDEYVDLYFCNAKSPCFIKDENSYIYMILPVKID